MERALEGLGLGCRGGEGPGGEALGEGKALGLPIEPEGKGIEWLKALVERSSEEVRPASACCFCFCFCSGGAAAFFLRSGGLPPPPALIYHILSFFSYVAPRSLDFARSGRWWLS